MSDKIYYSHLGHVETLEYREKLSHTSLTTRFLVYGFVFVAAIALISSILGWIFTR